MTKRHYLSFLSAALLSMAMNISGNAISFFVEPITTELGFARSSFSLYLSLSTLIGVFVMPFIGQFLPKFGAKKLLMVGGTWVSLGFLWLSGASHLWQFYAGGIFLGLFLSPITMFLGILLINNWFDAKKGLMMGLLNASGGLAGVLISMLMPTFLAAFGWRSGYLLVAACFALLTIPNALFLLVEHPENIGMRAYGELDLDLSAGDSPAPATSLSYNEAKKTKQFYILFAGILLSAFTAGLMQHLPAHLSDIGFTPTEVGSLFSILMAGLIVANISVGAVNDKIDSSITVLFVSLCVITALFFMATTTNYIVLALLMLIFAFGLGGPGVLTPLVVGETFGKSDYSRIWSILGTAPAIGIAISGPLWGAIYDVTGSYKVGMYGMISLAFIYCACYIFTLKTSPIKKTAVAATTPDLSA